MAKVGPLLERATTVLVVACIVAITFVVVSREFFPSERPGAASPQAEDVEGWWSLAASGHQIGAEHPNVRILVYSDFECPACRSFVLNTLTPLLEEFPEEVAYVFKHWPLEHHRFALPAARAAECAAEQGRFEELHDLLYLKQDSLGLKPFESFAAEAGIEDVEAFDRCLAENPTFDVIEMQRQEASTLGGTGTPTVIVDGVRHPSPPSLDELRDYVRAAGPPSGGRANLGQTFEMPPLDELQRLTLTQEVTVDGEEAGLVPVRWMLPLSGGSVVVSQDQTSTLPAWDRDGRALFVAGGRGQGPGEFLTLNSAGLKADTLWVFDFRQGRITYLDAQGEVARTERLPDRVPAAPADPLGPEAWSSLIPLSLGEDGSVIAQAFPQDRSHADAADRLIHIVRFDPKWTAGHFVDTVPRQPQVAVRTRGGSGVAMIPFTRPPLLEFSPTGESMAFVDPALSGPGVGTFRVLMLDPSGATVYDHRFPFDPDPIPRSVRDSALADRLEGLQERGMPELARSLTREGVLPEVYPPFTGAIVEPDGRLWIESRSRDEERTYLILDPDGGPEAWTTVPANTTIRAVDGDYVWGTARDEFGVESVVRFRRELERPPG